MPVGGGPGQQGGRCQGQSQIPQLPPVSNPQVPKSLSVVEDRLPNGSRCCVDLDNDVATEVISVRQELPKIDSTFHMDRFGPRPSSSLALGNGEVLRLVTRQSLRREESETTQQANHNKKMTGARTDFAGAPVSNSPPEALAWPGWWWAC